ncbi:hypothetical protein PSI19_15135 [Xenorhabdus khoisanae]|nr:hypothetical protein [Xenorhabdus khoisanae]MDC9615176.1 hypothetical protein [Xenorhabdus khoisanae]
MKTGTFLSQPFAIASLQNSSDEIDIPVMPTGILGRPEVEKVWKKQLG